MDRRLLLHQKLVEALGSTHVYFQPPEKLKLIYPAIVYSRLTRVDDYADDIHYHTRQGYRVIVIDENPDSPIVLRLMNMPYSSWRSHNVADGLNQDTFTIFY